MLTIESLSISSKAVRVFSGSVVNRRAFQPRCHLTIEHLDHLPSKPRSATKPKAKPAPKTVPKADPRRAKPAPKPTQSHPLPKPAPAPAPVQVPADPYSLQAALDKNGWDPCNPPPLKRGYYLDPRELFYRVIRVQQLGGIDEAGRDGARLVELLSLLANGYLGKIIFQDNGHMANYAEDMVQEALTKCVLIVTRFDPWEADRNTKVKTGRLNNAFAYFTTVIRNKFFETLGSNLSGDEVHLEDLKAENACVGDLF